MLTNRYLLRLILEVLLSVTSFGGPAYLPDLTDAFETVTQGRQEAIGSNVRRHRQR